LLLYSFITDVSLGLNLFIDVSIFSKIVDKGLGLRIEGGLVNNKEKSFCSLKLIKDNSIGYKS